MTQGKHPEIDTTRIVNITGEKFTWYINGQPIVLEIGEAKPKPLYVAQIGAKHMVDYVLQKKHNVKDTNVDSPIRKSLFAEILPDFAEEINVKPLSDEAFRQQVQEQLDKQQQFINSLTQVKRDDTRVAELEKQVAELQSKLVLKRGGRPKKTVEQPAVVPPKEPTPGATTIPASPQ